MKKLKFLLFFILALSLISSGLTGLAADEDGFSVEAGAAILVNMDTGRVLFEQNADALMYPASLTKLLTCLIAIELGNLDDPITASETAYIGLIEAGSTANIQPGETLTLRDLLYCALLPSANEACNIIAEYISGSVGAFVDLMNEKAQAMGCTNTHFSNATGLHSEDHYTTARDMAVIAQTAFKNDTLRLIAGTPEYTLPATNKNEERVIYSTDQLISDHVNSNYLYEYAVAGKTGYTTPAGRCLISCAQKDGITLVSVVMKTDSVVLNDGSTRVMSFYETRRLFEYGFSNWSMQTLVSAGTPVTEVGVKLGAEADTLVLCAQSPVTYYLRKDFDLSQISRIITVYNEDNITAPVEKGQELGKLELYDQEGNLLGETALVAQNQVSRSMPETVVHSVRSVANQPLVKAVVIVVVIIAVLLILVVLLRRRIEKRREAEERKRRRVQELRRRQIEEANKYKR